MHVHGKPSRVEVKAQGGLVAKQGPHCRTGPWLASANKWDTERQIAGGGRPATALAKAPHSSWNQVTDPGGVRLVRLVRLTLSLLMMLLRSAGVS